jgi:hypothetical protein
VSGRHLSHADAETVSEIPTEVNVTQELGVRRTQRGSRRDKRRRGDGQSDEPSGFRGLLDHTVLLLVLAG